MKTTVYLGILRGEKHMERLSEVAAWLDQNKFSCTFSVVDNRAMMDIDAPESSGWTKDDFEKYVMEIVIHSLVRHME
jgi:hypothetical protein